jgi:phosphonopyruvate decarboxylase
MRTEELWKMMDKEGLTFFTGVPDSTFKAWMSFLDDNNGKGLQNVIACNECEAVAIAAGYHLATGNVGVAYMQNAGEGKTVNPITSLADPEVYSIPMLLMIGWRGMPGMKDEPQHKKMGRVTLPLLETLEIQYRILPEELDRAEKVIAEMKETAMKSNAPVALVIKRGLIEAYSPNKKSESIYPMSREDAIKTIVDSFSGDEAVVSTTGKASRELFEHRVARGETPKDFYTVGSMGCSASIALGVAMQKPDKKVYVFDGDGAVLMQMGTLSTIGHYKPTNLYHIVFDNNSYESTGGQPTVSDTVNFEKVALACGYSNAKTVESKSALDSAVTEMASAEGPYMLIVKVMKGARKDLGRPTSTPVENKKRFREALK